VVAFAHGAVIMARPLPQYVQFI